MRIAILFFGRIKNYDKHFQNIMQNIVQNNQVDFFLSHSRDLDEDVDGFVKLYKPIAVFNGEIVYFDHSKYKKRNDKQGHPTMCMLVNKMRAFKLLNNYVNETGIDYDVVISYRLDVKSKDELNLNIENNKLYIPEGKDYGGINDQMAYGSFEVMKKYMMMYNSLYDILERGCVFHPETLLKKYLDNIKIDIVRFPFFYWIVR